MNWLKRKWNRFWNPVQVGDVWGWKYHHNPFISRPTTWEVLEVQGKYVKYSVNYSEGSYIDSSSITFFLIGTKLISEKQ